MGHAKAKKPHPGKGAAFRVYQSSGLQNGSKQAEMIPAGGKVDKQILMLDKTRLVSRALLF